jgi:hypothetical protein
MAANTKTKDKAVVAEEDKPGRGSIKLKVLNTYTFLVGNKYIIAGEIDSTGIRKPKINITVTEPDGEIVLSEDLDGDKESFKLNFIADATGEFTTAVSYEGIPTGINPSAEITVQLLPPPVKPTTLTIEEPSGDIHVGDKVKINGSLTY